MSSWLWRWQQFWFCKVLKQRKGDPKEIGLKKLSEERGSSQMGDVGLAPTCLPISCISRLRCHRILGTCLNQVATIPPSLVFNQSNWRSVSERCSELHLLQCHFFRYALFWCAPFRACSSPWCRAAVTVLGTCKSVKLGTKQAPLPKEYSCFSKSCSFPERAIVCVCLFLWFLGVFSFWF